ncbi:hypothetical protein ACL7TT_10295 [Microbulbifer sp. 2304DJ12-6]|uniref:hypothetical protein n=1 Tax=Microbulbifer sp. 2304DJ12-6 TaxID=3233340 RepID=UPI0039B1041A
MSAFINFGNRIFLHHLFKGGKLKGPAAPTRNMQLLQHSIRQVLKPTPFPISYELEFRWPLHFSANNPHLTGAVLYE